jgi:hypothetical protein
MAACLRAAWSAFCLTPVGFGPTILALYAIDAIGLVLAFASLALDHPGKA